MNIELLIPQFLIFEFAFAINENTHYLTNVYIQSERGFALTKHQY